MIEHILDLYLPIIINLLELMGIIVIIVGAFKVFYKFIFNKIDKGKVSIKLELANYMAMALEFKLAAEILKTVIVRSISELWILGAVTLLRAIMVILIHFEMKWEKEEDVFNKKVKKDMN